MITREAKPSDAAAICRLLAQLGYPEIDATLIGNKIDSHSQPGYHLMVAEDDQQVVGFIALHWFELLHWNSPMGRMTSFCIDEKFRSKGIGKMLLDASEEFLSKKGCVKFEVTSNARRTRSHGFYIRHGYVEDSRRFVKYQQ